MLKQTDRQERHLRSHAVRALASTLTLLVVFLASSLPVFGAVRFHRPHPRIDYLAADGSSCATTKVLHVGRLSLHRPSCWAFSIYPSDNFVSYSLLGVLSNQPVHNPCSTTQSETGSTTRCGYPLSTLKRGGVLIMLNIGSASGSGRRFEVDHHVARESVTRDPSGSLRATDEINVAIHAGTPDNFYKLVAFFRSPGVPKDQRLLDQMLGSMKIE